MGTIHSSWALDRAQSIFQVIGEVEAHSVLSRLRQAHAAHTSAMHLWDFTHGAVRYDPAEDGHCGQEAFSRLHGGLGMHTALVCPNELDHGLLRIVRHFGQRGLYPRRLRAFRCMRAAQRWLGACTLCLAKSAPSPELRCAKA